MCLVLLCRSYKSIDVNESTTMRYSCLFMNFIIRFTETFNELERLIEFPPELIRKTAKFKVLLLAGTLIKLKLLSEPN